MKSSWVEIDLDGLESNLRALRSALSAGAEAILVVKSDAYGHGLVPVSGRAWRCGVRWFAVAHLNSALRLREALPEAGILVLSPIEPGDVRVAAQQGITPIVVDGAHAARLSEAGEAAGLRLPCHVKVDTGMGRLGFAWDSIARSIVTLRAAAGLQIDGMLTHLASAAPGNRGFAIEQVRRFRNCLAKCRAAGVQIPFSHVSNSGGFLCEPGWDFDAARVGILAYGYGAKGNVRVLTEPFLHWKATVVQVKHVAAGFPVGYDSTYFAPCPTQIATVNVGYADGYPRVLSNKGEVLIRGHRRRIAGRVTMNLITVDAGPRGDVCEGDEVVLLGRQGTASIGADELAAGCHTISYEILTGISPLLERRVMRE